MSVDRRTRVRSLWPQPIIGTATATLALLATAVSWLYWHGSAMQPPVIALSGALVIAVVAAYQFPLHIRRYSKIWVSSVAYYLLAALVPVPLAATAAALGSLLGELSVRKRRSNRPATIASQVGRRTVVVLLGAWVAHLSGDAMGHVLALVGAVVVLEVGDIVTYPLALGPVSGEPPARIIATAARQAYLIEGVQYLIGLLGALAIGRHFWAVALLLLPTILVYLAFSAMAQAQEARRAAETAEREASEARRVAEEAVRVRDDFLIAASHDLRTPLTNLVGRGDLMQMHVDGPEPVTKDWLRTQVRSLRDSTRRMSSTVEEITDAAHLQMGQTLTLRVERVDVGEMVETVVRMVEQAEAVTRRGASPVVVDAPPGLVVDGDRARLERVAQNVIGNAIKYSPGGAAVHVEIRRRDAHVAVVVRDQGVGIPSDELPHVFTHFYRARTSIGTKGTGIGLAGARKIVELHGGSIAVDSAVGRGTTVTVLLPAAALPLQQQQPHEREDDEAQEQEEDAGGAPDDGQATPLPGALRRAQ